jgi:hypothetical protein
MSPRIAALLLGLVVAACDSGGSTTPIAPAGPLTVRDVDPQPAATGVSRRAIARITFDGELDPTSATPERCYLERPGVGPLIGEVRWDATTRTLSILAATTLLPDTWYRANVTEGLRSTGGAELTSFSWSFTTGDDATWDRASDFGEGELLACEPSRVGGMLVMSRAGDGSTWFTRGSDGAWLESAPLELPNVRTVAVTDDSGGAVVVAAATLPFQNASLWLVRHMGGTAFFPPEPLDNGWFDHVTVSHDNDSLLVAARRLSSTGPDGTWMRAWTLGLGWQGVQWNNASHALAHVEPTGAGVIVHGFNWVQPFDQYVPWCERTCFPFGNPGLSCDPRPHAPNDYSLGSKLRVRPDRLLVAQTVAAATPQSFAPVARAFEWRVGSGWELLPGELAPDPVAHDVAIGPSGTALLASLREGQQPDVRARDDLTFIAQPISFTGHPAPASPAIAAAITSGLISTVLWTAHDSASPGAPVSLVASTRAPNGGWQAPVVVDGPFAPGAVRNLRVLSSGPQTAIAMWSRDGRVFWSRMH